MIMSNKEIKTSCTDCGSEQLEKDIHACSACGTHGGKLCSDCSNACDECGKHLCDEHCLVRGSVMYHEGFCRECYDKRFS